MKVGVVMPCINLWNKYTLPALQSVATAQRMAAQKGIVSQVLLIDNASSDETQMSASHRAGVEYHRNNDMWGFQRSVNFGVKRFMRDGYDIVLVLNNDIVLHPAAIWRLVERFKASERNREALRDTLGMAGAPTVPDQTASEDVPESAVLGMVTCLDVTGESWRNPQKMASLSDVEKEACPESEHPNFSAFAINRMCWQRVGEMDELYAPAYFEDNDYHYRLKLAGVKAVCYPPAMFLHWGSGTQNEAIGRPIVPGPEFENKRAEFTRKWGGPPGQERFKVPYNDEAKTLLSVKQLV